MFNAFDKMFDMLSQYLEKFFKKSGLTRWFWSSNDS